MSAQNLQTGEDRHRAKVIAQVQRKSLRHQIARKTARHGIHFGLGMFGMVGWSVAVPTLLGLGLGIWLDHAWQSTFSWTLTGLLAGIVMGCFNAWYWISKEISDDASQPEKKEAENNDAE